MISLVLSESLLFKEMSSVYIRSITAFKFLPLNSVTLYMSSANKIFKSNRDTLHISLTDKINRSGPRMDPWGTPHLILSVSDFFTIKYHILCSVRQIAFIVCYNIGCAMMYIVA